MSRHLRRHYSVAGVTHDLDVTQEAGRVRVEIDGAESTGDARVLRPFPGGADLVVTHEGGRSRAVVLREGDTVYVAMRGRVHRLGVVAARSDAAVADAASIDPFIASPMTGVVRKVVAVAGNSFATGETLVVVEAMKMEFSVEAPRSVVVAEVRVAPGDRVDIGQVLVTFAVARAEPTP